MWTTQSRLPQEELEKPPPGPETARRWACQASPAALLPRLQMAPVLVLVLVMRKPLARGDDDLENVEGCRRDLENVESAAMWGGVQEAC
jgi:hypothetical protein